MFGPFINLSAAGETPESAGAVLERRGRRILREML